MDQPCHICQSAAVGRCYNCGELVCAEHGKGETCPTCSGGYMPGDPRGVSVEPLPKEGKGAWWRPKEAEEYHPPECYECKGLARRTCRNCQAKYCPEHAGPSGLCLDCGRSANMGLIVFGVMALLIGLLLLFGWYFG
ncbi:MAG: hypothetical protein HYR84_02365 [Planctomycetes bacterium]|nr:hypothetical protein [Planctomycetota bacterium]